MKKYVVLVILLGVAGLGAVEINPWDFFSANAMVGPAVRIDSTTGVQGDLVAAGALVEVSAPLPKDASLSGAEVRIDADVAGDLVAAGAVVEVSGKINGSSDVRGAVIHLDGTFNDSLAASGAVVYLKGHVNGPVMLSGAEVHVEEGAIIEDTLRYDAGKLDIAQGAVLKSPAKKFVEAPLTEKKQPGRAFGGWLIGTIIGTLFFIGAGLLMVIISGRHLKHISDQVLIEPGRSALLGGIALVVFPFVFVIGIILFFTVIGTAAGIFLAAVYGIGFVFSTVYAGTTFGRFILGKLNKGKEPHIALCMLLGVFITVLLCRIPYMGILVWLAVFVFGFGAFISRRLEIYKVKA